MRRLLVIVLIVLFVSGCSFSRAWKWFDSMDWERDDQTIKFSDILPQ